MFITLASFGMSAANIVALWLISHHRARVGWILTLTLQAPWTVYNYYTHQYGFILLTVFTIGVAFKSLHNVHKHDAHKHDQDNQVSRTSQRNQRNHQHQRGNRGGGQ